MDNQRLILFLALAVVLLLMWDAWVTDYGDRSVQGPQPAPVSGEAEVPAIPTDVPKAPPASQTEVPAAGEPLPAAPGRAFASETRIVVETDVLRVEIDSVGGDIRQVDLLNYPVSTQDPSVPFRLMSDGMAYYFIAQSGLLSERAAPDHHTHYSAQRSRYVLADGQDAISIPLTWVSPEGVAVNKVYTFYRGRYDVALEHRVTNSSAAPWNASAYYQLQRTEKDQAQSSAFIYTYTGGVIYSEENKYEKIKFADMEDETLSRDIRGGWAAMIQHYFLAALIPPAQGTFHYYSKALGQQRYALGFVSPALTVDPAQSQVFKGQLYLGPKIQAALEEIAPGLELTVDYGVLTFLAKPLFWLLDWIHGVVGNWGWAIVILTLLIKLVFYKLSETSYRSMANMRRLQPRIMAIRERYGDDRQRMSQAMMELYKKEKINPLGGCLPILVQIPVFIALYWVLLESVELRQAPFVLWLNDLSTKDPYYILPVLMGVTMFIQQKLNPAPPDPIQAKVMMALPIVFTLFFAFFPAGLVLYWLANNVLSIAQQWLITRRVEQAAR